MVTRFVSGMQPATHPEVWGSKGVADWPARVRVGAFSGLVTAGDESATQRDARTRATRERGAAESSEEHDPARTRVRESRAPRGPREAIRKFESLFDVKLETHVSRRYNLVSSRSRALSS